MFFIIICACKYSDTEGSMQALLRLSAMSCDCRAAEGEGFLTAFYIKIEKKFIYIIIWIIFAQY